MHCIVLYLYASRCYGLHLRVLNKETTYIYIYLCTQLETVTYKKNKVV